MKRRVLGYVAVVAVLVCLCAAPSFAADNFISDKVGVGYQGIIAGNLLNGVSARGWIGNNFGLEGTVFYGAAKADLTVDGTKGNVFDTDLWLVEAKVMYAFMVRSNSRFYAGAKFAYGQYDVKSDLIGGNLINGEVYIPGVLVGAEWSFPQLPEVGFNFDVGYNYAINQIDVPAAAPTDVNVDLNMHGVNVALGIHYYF